jgi:hypothetical protein
MVNQVSADATVDGADIAIGMFYINSIPVAILFDSGATHSFISTRYAKAIDSNCWGLVLKCYELRTRQHRMLNVKALRPLKHYFPKDLMSFGRRL